MSRNLDKLKVAIVSDHCFSFAGASYTTKVIGNIFENPDYFFLMGNRHEAIKYFNTTNIYFSFLNRFPFIEKYYRYTYPLWPFAIESFDLSKYDLVISSSFSVSHGVITGPHTKHIAYIHTPMRYAWDLYTEYFGNSSFIKREVIYFFLNILRIWDVSASNRADIVIANSKFVKDRIYKYWKRSPDKVIYPPVPLYNGDVHKNRGEYLVAGSPFEINKKGEFLLRCAVDIGFNLKLIGTGSTFKKLRKEYSKYKNIEFLGKISEEKKWDILSHARGFVCAGIEDFGIFPVEAMSCGTPVLAYMGGGYINTVVDKENGMFFKSHSIDEFKSVYEEFISFNWNREGIVRYASQFSEDRFKSEIEQVILKNL